MNDKRCLFVLHDIGFISPTGLQYLSAIAKKQLWEVRLATMARQDVMGIIKSWEPSVVAYSTCTGEHKYYNRFNTAVKEIYPEIWTIMGGPHPTFFPSTLYIDHLDAICVGEGEYAFADFLYTARGGKGWIMGLDSIPNLHTVRNHNVPRPLIQDLDSLPMPDVSLFYGPPDNCTTMGANNLKNFMTGRGCPYNCTYCFNHAWKKIYKDKGKLIRRHSVDYIFDLLKYVQSNYPLAVVKFYDDIFAFSLDDWLIEFGERYPKEIGLPFYILTRADLLTEDIVRILKQAGCTTISMSVEAGRECIRNDMLKRSMSDDQIRYAFGLCRKYGIMVFSNTMLGLPDTNIDDDFYSVEFNIEIGTDYAEFPIFFPYPGTDLGNYAISRGLFHGDFDNMAKYYMGRSPLSSFNRVEKDIHSNLSLLGMIAVTFPFLWPVLRLMSKVPHTNFINKLYTVMYQIIKTFMIRRVYPTNTPWRKFLPILWESFRQEFLKHKIEE